MDWDLQPYPEYKDSGVSWLGEIPAHWKTMPNRSVFLELKERNNENERMLSVTIAKGVIKQEDLLADSSKKDSSNLDKSKYKLVLPGYLAYNKMRAWQGAIGVSNYRGIVSPAYIVVRLRESHHPQYFHYLFRTPAFAKEAERWSYGITSDQWSLRSEDFKQIYCSVPPFDEQSAIVRFLDHIDQRIRRYIRAKKKLIALLNGQKQVIIQQAVTRGLDPNVRLKPSGVEWLGDIPEHWSTSRLKLEASHIIDCIHATPEYLPDGQYPAVRTADIEPGKLRLEHIRKISYDQYMAWTSRLTPRKGDILYSREGERFGIAALVPDGIELCISQRMTIFRIKDTRTSEFLMWQLNCQHVYAQAACKIIGSTSPHINVEQIKNYRLVIPPLKEQEQIVATIKKDSVEIDNAIIRTKKKIDLLREYRTRLIADVVTGKLDVREVAKNLPEETEYPEPLDEAGGTESSEEAEENERGADDDIAD